MKPRVAFIVHMLVPYRVSFYKKLFADPDYDWKLFAGYKFNKNDARPQYEGQVDFPVSYHTEVVRKLGIYNMIDNEGMLESVQAFEPDFIIMFSHVGTKSFRMILNWAKASNRKVLMWTSFWEPDYISGYKRIIRNFFIKSFYKKADYHITYSSAAREKLLSIGYPDAKISIAYNGVDLDMYESDLKSAETNANVFEPDAVNFLYVGGFGSDKKVDLLIQAVYKCTKSSSHKINAYLIGDGPMYESCEALVHKLKITEQVKFLGRITKHLGKYIKAADCIVLPGTGGLIMNEAILFQKPIIVSDADGTEKDLLVNGFNGLKFLPGSHSSLANALHEMGENLSYFQENATKIASVVTKRSNVDFMVVTFLKVLKKLTLCCG